VEQSLGTEAGEPRHRKREHERRGGLLTAGVILAILLSSFIAAEISRGQSPESNGQPILVPHESSASSTPAAAASNKIVILPPVSSSPEPRPAPRPRAGGPPGHVPTAPPPVTAGTVDLALHRPVTATSYTQAYYPANVTDGDTSTYWESQGAFPQSVTVDLGSATGISRIVLTLPPSPDWNSRIQTLAIYGSQTSAVPAFTIAGSARYTFDAARGDTATINFTPVTARYVTVYFTANSGWPAAQLSEIGIYS
jgi:F5/8 type C domain